MKSMKKSILLGAATLATVIAVAGSASAGETKIGGYYMFRGVDADTSITDNAPKVDNARYMSHRLQLNMDFLASAKTHAHLVTRAFDNVIQGADAPQFLGPDDKGGLNAGSWGIHQGWLETEAWGVGVKVGSMPISLNDDILVNHDTTSFGTFLLAKSFGDITLVGADVKIRENDGVKSTTANDVEANDDDEDLYVLSLLGKAPGELSYQVTAAYGNLGKAGVVASAINPDNAATLNTDERGRLHDWWLAATVKAPVANLMTLTGTLIYENGLDGFNAANNPAAAALTNRLSESGFLGAVRAKGKTGFGGWNAYGFYATEDFTNITNDNPVWSDTWDQGGPGAKDLLKSFMATVGFSPTENAWGVGAGLTVEAAGWKINPMLDYVSLVENEYTFTNAIGASVVNKSRYDSAYGGSLMLTTDIDKDTSLLLGGTYIVPQDGPAKVANDGLDAEGQHFLQAAIKMKF